MSEPSAERLTELKQLASRKLTAVDRTGFGLHAKDLAKMLRDDEVPTTIGAGGLEGNPGMQVFVMVTREGLVLAHVAARASKNFAQRLPYGEIEQITVETPGVATRWNLLGKRQAHLLIRTPGELIRIKLMARHLAEEIRELTESRIG
jgi:hypothetical protein